MSPKSDAATAVLSVVLIVFSLAGILLETTYRNNSPVEAALCRFNVCDTEQFLRHASTTVRTEAVKRYRAARFRRLARSPSTAPRMWTTRVFPSSRWWRQARLYRQPSEKFANKIAGAAWIDSISLTRAT